MQHIYSTYLRKESANGHDIIHPAHTRIPIWTYTDDTRLWYNYLPVMAQAKDGKQYSRS